MVCLLVLFGATTAANSATAFLATDDFVGISFWLISMGMLAATAFFFMEQANVGAQWRKSVNVAGLVTGIAFIHYMYMRAVWVETGDTPTVYRYIDWLITVPLQLVEFYLILSAVKKVPTGIFWRILIGSLVMLIGGYLGDHQVFRQREHYMLQRMVVTQIVDYLREMQNLRLVQLLRLLKREILLK